MPRVCPAWSVLLTGIPGYPAIAGSAIRVPSVSCYITSREDKLSLPESNLALDDSWMLYLIHEHEWKPCYCSMEQELKKDSRNG